MQAALTFNLPDEKAEYNMAIRGPEYYSALFDLRNQFRSWNKQGNDPSYQEIADYFYSLLRDLNFE